MLYEYLLSKLSREQLLLHLLVTVVSWNPARRREEILGRCSGWLLGFGFLENSELSPSLDDRCEDVDESFGIESDRCGLGGESPVEPLGVVDPREDTLVHATARASLDFVARPGLAKLTQNDPNFCRWPSERIATAILLPGQNANQIIQHVEQEIILILGPLGSKKSEMKITTSIKVQKVPYIYAIIFTFFPSDLILSYFE